MFKLGEAGFAPAAAPIAARVTRPATPARKAITASSRTATQRASAAPANGNAHGPADANAQASAPRPPGTERRKPVPVNDEWEEF